MVWSYGFFIFQAIGHFLFIYSVSWFSIYLFLWIRSNVPARSLGVLSNLEALPVTWKTLPKIACLCKNFVSLTTSEVFPTKNLSGQGRI